MQMKLMPELLVMNGENIVPEGGERQIVSLNYMPMPLRKLPEAFGLSAEKSWYPHLFNTTKDMNYGGLAPDVSYYSVDQMHESERKEFLSWYQTVAKVFHNGHVRDRY